MHTSLTVCASSKAYNSPTTGQSPTLELPRRMAPRWDAPGPRVQPNDKYARMTTPVQLGGLEMPTFIYRANDLAECARQIITQSRRPLVAVAFWGKGITENLGLSSAKAVETIKT